MTAETLSTAIVRFNFNPISYCHPSWWIHKGLPKETFRQLAENPTTAPILSKKMMADYHIEDKLDFDFDHPFKRIALLDYKQQRRIVLQLGLLIYRARLAQAICFEEQKRLFEIIDYNDYLLALRLKLDHRVVSEEHLPVLPTGNKLLCRLQIYLAGFTLLLNIVSTEATGFKRRFYFTWPKQVLVKRLHFAFYAGRRRVSSQPEHVAVKRLAKLQDFALYCMQLNNPTLIAEGRRLGGQLLLLQGY